MSLNHCSKCLWVFVWLHYCRISLKLWSLCAISFECSYWCAQPCLLQILRLLIVHSFSVPSLAVNGRVRRTPKGTPTVVRRGQTDWVHRLLCGLPGVHRGPGPLLPRAPHSSRAGRLPTVQCFQLGGWMCCAPAEMASGPV